MFERKYREEADQISLSEEKLAAILAAMDQEKEGNPVKKTKTALKAALIAAILCVTLVVSVSAAALLGAFDRLKEQDDFALLGLTEAYEAYAYDVNATAMLDNGDVFTLDKAATDGTFCTLFYSYRYRDPQMPPEEFKNRDSFWAYMIAPQMELLAEGERVNLYPHMDSFEYQEYLADERTVYGAWRTLLDTDKLGECDEIELQGRTYDETLDLWREFSVRLPLRPTAVTVDYPDVRFPMRFAGKTITVEVDSLSRSPFGTFLKLHYEDDSLQTGVGLLDSFALRDKDTGRYIPIISVTIRRTQPHLREEIYELMGDVSDVKTLELIPVQKIGSLSRHVTVPLSQLPYEDREEVAGNYAPASYQVVDGRILVEMKPLGAVTAQYPALSNGVGLLDAEGKDLECTYYCEKFKDRSTGSVIVALTPAEPEELQQIVDKAAALWFFVEDYTLLEDQAVALQVSDAN